MGLRRSLDAGFQSRQVCHCLHGKIPVSFVLFLKSVFHFNRIVAKRIVSLFREHSSKTNDMDIIEYATFRYDTIEVENALNAYIYL